MSASNSPNGKIIQGFGTYKISTARNYVAPQNWVNRITSGLMNWQCLMRGNPSIQSSIFRWSCRLHEDGLAAEADLFLLLQLQLRPVGFFIQQRGKNEQRKLSRPGERGGVIGCLPQWGVQFRSRGIVEQTPQQSVFQFIELGFLHGPKRLCELRRQLKSRFGREPGWHGLSSSFHFFFLFVRRSS
jgi:hypothetical protein